MSESAKTVTFSKFFPDDNAYVNLKGKFSHSDDWSINLSIQSGPRYSVDFWTSEWNHVEMKQQLIALKEAVNQTLTFIDECTCQKTG
jgi:hypothetical protein